MATPSHANAVKSLNDSYGRRRFVFKTFSQRIEDIDIDVYRSLDPVKDDPSVGSSFFRDCLTEWKELNTAEDFISFYEEMVPSVQTLPLVFLHRELILSKLLSRLRMKARLSLEPILRLIAALSRDLLEDFIPFLPRVADSLASLLKDGADREPEIIEQIFSSWSLIMMYMQRYLIRDTVSILKFTMKLRYYPKEYIQEFMAEAMSFLLRNAPDEQRKKGIKKIMHEVVQKPSPVRNIGVSSLLFYIMRGISLKFHSKAKRVLQLLMKRSTFNIADKFGQGSEVIVEVVAAAFQRVCEEFESEELETLYGCLYQEFTNTIENDCSLHQSRLLTLLISTIQTSKGCKISDYQTLCNLVDLLLQKYILHSTSIDAEVSSSDIIDKILQLILCILDELWSSNNTQYISACSSKWAFVFKLKTPSLSAFVGELLQKDPFIISKFRINIISAINILIETSAEDVVYLLLCLFEKLQPKTEGESESLTCKPSKEELSSICKFLELALCSWIGVIKDVRNGLSSSAQLCMMKLAELWGIICCYPHILDEKSNSCLLSDLLDVLDRLMKNDAGSIEGVHKNTWEALIGATLNSYHQSGRKSDLKVLLDLAKRYKSSSQVLSAVSNSMDSLRRQTGDEEVDHKLYQLELSKDGFADAAGVFADNLRHSDKRIRVSTLKILGHYEPWTNNLDASDEQIRKKLRCETSPTCDVNSQDVLDLLLSIETVPLCISTSRKVSLLISRVQMELSCDRVPEAYLAPALNGIIGIFHNRFRTIWDQALECLAFLIKRHMKLVWIEFVCFLEQCQMQLRKSYNQYDGEKSNTSNESTDLVERFKMFVSPPLDSTPCSTVLSLMLQSLQKIPSDVEARSRDLVPLFLKFLGYNIDNLESVGSFDSQACKGKEWKAVLKEWLYLFKLMKNPKSFYKSQFLKEVLLVRLLDENDAEVQMEVLNCLLTWKDEVLLPYGDHLKNLISARNWREEMTTWSISRESKQIEEGHRAYVVPTVLRLLTPKIRTMKTLASRKHTSGHHRKAVLGFIAQLDVDELPLFFAMLMKPFHFFSRVIDGTVDCFYASSGQSMEEFRGVDLLKHFTLENICSLSWKKRYGFMHVIQDILGTFDELRVRPFLDLLMGAVVQILRSCTCSLAGANESGYSELAMVCISQTAPEKTTAAMDTALSSTGSKQLKDLRSLCLKIVSLVLNKYEDYDFGPKFWDLFFVATKSLIQGFKLEGSSSERPSSLFSCFLAMSGHHRLAPLLSREKNLVSDIFSILSVPKASDAIISFVLKFIENLLELASEVDGEDTKKILIPNLETLVTNLHCLLSGERGMARKFVKGLGDTVIGIFKLLSNYIKDAFPAKKFIDILLPFLTKEYKNQDSCVKVMKILRDVIPVSGSDSTSKILSAVSPLLTHCELQMRLCISDVIDALSTIDPSVLIVAKVVRELNATSEMDMSGVDYDTIVNAYEKIDVDIFRTIREDHAIVIMSHFVYDMSSDELILRHSAYRSLLAFVEFSAQIIGQELNGLDIMTDAVVAPNDGCWTKANIQRVVTKFLLKHMGGAMGRGGSVRKEWVDLLRQMILRLPEVANLGSFKALCSEDAEIDFFSNIVHLQKHRRARALLRFKNVVSSGRIAEGITNKVFVPLFFGMLYDLQDGKGENIRCACIGAIGSICGQMEWKSYYALLSRCLREMAKFSERQKVLLRLICSILDQFHFSEPCSGQQETTDIDAGSCSTGPPSVSSRCNSTIAIEIQNCFQKNVLPKIQKLLDSDSDKINVNVSLAVLKILKLLPAEIMDSQLSSIVHRISNFLKSRNESARDEARSALAVCLKELGLAYLQFVMKVLRATLKRGYELHVLGYTTNFILSKVITKPVFGELDHCLDDLLTVVVNDILGDVAEEKEVGKIASKMKETRKIKSFETLKLVAQCVTFNSHAMKLLSPITSHSSRLLSPKIKLKYENMLNHIAAGIESNPSVDQTDLFIFIYHRVKEGIDEENNTNENTSTRNDVSNKRATMDLEKRPNSLRTHLITVFALGLLHTRIKNIKLKKDDEDLLNKLDPFVVLLCDCLHSKYEDVITLSLRCLNPLVRLPLPSLASQAGKMKEVLLSIAQSSVNASNPLMQSCLGLLTVLLRSTSITLSDQQLRTLIQFPIFIDLERNPSFVALSLLKAIISRKQKASEIYDISTQVSKLMVTSQEESVRRKCSKILLQFLLDYPLTGNRLEQHLDSLLSSLRYEHPTGREAVLEMLHAIIMKFPNSVVDEQSQIIFINLVVCLANDCDSKVRSMTAAAIRLLIGRISPKNLDSILGFSLTWYLDENQRLWGAAAQVLGLFAEVMKKGFEKHFHSVLPKLRYILQSATSIVSDRQLDLSEEASIPFWKEAYYSLVMLEKMLHQSNRLSLDSDLEDIWEVIVELLLHPHTWLRNIACRLVAFYFSTVTAVTGESHQISLGSFFLMRPSRLFLIAASLCCQLKAQPSDDAVCNLITQNLVFTICGMQSLMQMGSADRQKYWSILEQDDHSRFLRGFHLLDSRKGRGLFASLISGAHDQNNQGPIEDPRHVLVSAILKRMGKIALQTEDSQMKTVFNSYQKVSIQLGSDDCMVYSHQLLLPLYKVSENFAGKIISDDVKQRAEDVCQTLRNILGSENFIQIYSQIRKNLKAKRDKRKQEEKIMAVVNPERNAKRKLRISAKNSAHKKRKLMSMKMGKWMR